MGRRGVQRPPGPKDPAPGRDGGQRGGLQPFLHRLVDLLAHPGQLSDRALSLPLGGVGGSHRWHARRRDHYCRGPADARLQHRLFRQVAPGLGQDQRSRIARVLLAAVVPRIRPDLCDHQRRADVEPRGHARGVEQLGPEGKHAVERGRPLRAQRRTGHRKHGRR